MCGGHQDPLCPDPGPRDGLCGFEFRIWRKRRCGTEQRHQLEGRWDSALGPSPEFCRGVKKQLSPPPAMVGDGVMGWGVANGGRYGGSWRRSQSQRDGVKEGETEGGGRRGDREREGKNEYFGLGGRGGAE